MKWQQKREWALVRVRRQRLGMGVTILVLCSKSAQRPQSQALPVTCFLGSAEESQPERGYGPNSGWGPSAEMEFGPGGSSPTMTTTWDMHLTWHLTPRHITAWPGIAGLNGPGFGCPRRFHAKRGWARPKAQAAPWETYWILMSILIF